MNALIASSRVLNVAVKGQITVRGVVNVRLVDAATGQIIKTVSSLLDEVLADPALPADALQFFKTPLGREFFFFLLNTIVIVTVALHQDASQRQTDQLFKQIAHGVAQIAQSVEQTVPSHSEQAPPTPKKPSPSPSKQKTPASGKNQKTRHNQRARKKKE